jgi:signal transduction histidine kinase
MRGVKALGRCLRLLGIALASPFMFVWVIVVLSTGVFSPWAFTSVRWFPNLARKLAGVPVDGVYWDPPEDPVPDEDGLFRVGNRLVDESTWWTEFDQRLDWTIDDPASWRDLNWLLTNLFIGGPIAGLAPAMAGTGIWLLFGSWWAAGIGLLAGAWLVAPRLVRLHDRWTALMLKAKHDGLMFRFWRRVRNRVKQVARAILLVVLALPNFLVSVVILVAGVPIHIWGLWIFAWAPIVRTGRLMTSHRRSVVARWSGIAITDPYLPHPPAPKPRPDGMYRDGKQLYKTPNALMRAARYRWVMTDHATWRDFASAPVDLLFGLIAIPLVLVRGEWGLRLQGKVSRLLLGPTDAALLALRVQQLTETRADATSAQAAELRRIERDLHDGAQARLVALGLHLGAVEKLIDRDPQAAKSLVAKTKEVSAEALVELRDLVRGIHPPVLAERGLTDALRALALDSPMDVTVHGSLATRPEAPIESAAYFAVMELLVNAAKHSHADRVTIHIGQTPHGIQLSVTDNGRGGAKPRADGGLSGLVRRLGTFDGTLDLDSPPGGPTIATVHIPSKS